MRTNEKYKEKNNIKINIVSLQRVHFMYVIPRVYFKRTMYAFLWHPGDLGEKWTCYLNLRKKKQQNKIH